MTAELIIDAILDLHTLDEDRHSCAGCGTTFPCRTVRLIERMATELDGDWHPVLRRIDTPQLVEGVL